MYKGDMCVFSVFLLFFFIYLFLLDNLIFHNGDIGQRSWQMETKIYNSDFSKRQGS